MAHQHVFLVQDNAFGLSSLKDRKAQLQQQRNGDSGKSLLSKIINHTHPRTGIVQGLITDAAAGRSGDWRGGGLLVGTPQSVLATLT